MVGHPNPSPRTHLLTVAIEDYFQAGSFRGLIPADRWERFESRLRRSTHAVLQLLADSGNRATFFCCGWIADHHPELLREVVAAGHEVACQGYFQHALHDIPPAAFALDLRRSRNAVEQVIGQAVQGHRIGRSWLRPADLWALGLVREAGFAYDASLRPLGRDFADDPGSLVVHQRSLRAGVLWEVPVSSTSVAGWRVPIAGGNWFRQAPDAPLRHAAGRWLSERNAPLVAYFHTWEFDPEQPRIAGTNAVQRLRHYRRLATMPMRLARLLAEHRFVSVAEHLQLVSAPVVIAAAPQPAPIITVRPVAPEPALPRRPLTLVVPCFNEAPVLPYLQRTLTRFATERGRGLELSYVFVDDGSRDGSAALLEQLAAALPRCTLLHHPANRGIAAALLTGFAACRTELVAVLDADCTFDPDQLPAMLDLLTDGVDVVSASPAHAAGAMKNVPAWRAAMSLGAAALYRRVLRQRLTSYTSCFRIYRMNALQGLVLADPGFCGVAEILGRLDLAGKRIVEFPARLETRLLGQSKLRVLRTVASHLRLLLRLAAARWLHRPLPNRVSAMAAH